MGKPMTDGHDPRDLILLTEALPPVCDNCYGIGWTEWNGTVTRCNCNPRPDAP